MAETKAFEQIEAAGIKQRADTAARMGGKMRRYLLAALWTVCPALLVADNPSVSIDWATRVKGAQACPGSVDKLTSVTLTVTGINDILYKYAVAESCVYLPNDAGNIFPSVATQQAMLDKIPPPPCDVASAAARSVRADHNLFPEKGRSVPLTDTVEAWKADQSWILSVRTAPPGCPDSGPDGLYDTKQRLDDYAKRIDSPHEKKFVFTLDKDQLCSLVLIEVNLITNTPTDATLSWKCGVDDTLTLSLGTLLTTIDYRDYTHRKVPVNGSPVDSLVVDGRGGWTPIGVGLLNYKIYHSDVGPHLGLTISSGPAFKLGGKAEVGTFGWFAGASVSMWRRFFITPGFHIGQFADFPAGFAPGQQIPANFGELTPVKRWTTRFAVGLTYRTNTLIKSTNTKTTGANPPAAPSKK